MEEPLPPRAKKKRKSVTEREQTQFKIDIFILVLAEWRGTFHKVQIALQRLMGLVAKLVLFLSYMDINIWYSDFLK